MQIMGQLFLWVMIAYGITNILVNGDIFLPVRAKIRMRAQSGKVYDFLDQMLKCMMCCSFWVGLFLALTWSPTGNLLFMSGLLSWLFDGFFASACVWIIHLLLKLTDKKDTTLYD
jgi:hypothetical protein